MRLFVLSFFLIVFSNLTFGQILNMPDGAGAPIRAKTGNRIEGDFYYNVDWSRGTVTWKNGNSSVNVLMKYNLFTKKVEIKSETSTWEFSAKEIESFIYDVNYFPEVESFSFKLGEKYGLKEYPFVRVYFDEKVTLLELSQLEIIENAPSYGSGISSTKVMRKTKLAVRKNTSAEFVNVKRNAKSFDKIFPGFMIRDFVKNNSLNLSQNKDLLTLLRYINNQI